MKPQEVDPRSLKPNPWNSNRVGPENMEKLKRSITDLGFASAVVVREIADGSLEILGGKHRVDAAIELGLKKIPILNLGPIDDVKAKKIGLVDNHRYGNDDVIQLAKILEEIGQSSAQLAEFLPVHGADLDAIIGAVNIDLEDFDLDKEDDLEGDDEDGAGQSERKEKTHDVLKFRVRVQDADPIRTLIEKTIKAEGFGGGDDMTSAGDALAHLLLKVD